ncbi:alpha/beta hydrolase [Streptomyces sp. NPDC047980]|uniref:alpha/beta hydrolase n=1 Tax=Streptomyces sp. NPDC047980 TaxID=3365494 RepID=UPI003723E190
MSSLTWQQLRDLKLGELDDAADSWGAVSRHADAADERVTGDMSGALSKTQESESAEAAVKRLKQLNRNYDYIKTECGLIRTAVSGLAAELASPQRRLKEALADAEAQSYTVHENGSIDYPTGGKNELTGQPVSGGTAVGRSGLYAPANNNGLLNPGNGYQAPGLINPNPHHAKAQDIADRIANALRDARETDARYQRTLDKLKAAPGLTVDAKTWADAAADMEAVREAAGDQIKREIPLDKSPADRKKWWDGLTEVQREEYLASYPDVIGNLDGIPALTRDEANRENLELLIAKFSGEDGEAAKARLGGLKEIQNQLELNAAARLTDRKEPPMYLLGIADEGTGRAIVAYGNPDTSRNVSAYVPGLGTALDDDFARNDLKRAHDTAVGARKHDVSSASIVWLGYDPPQLGGVDAETLLSNTDVMSADRAERGAPAYNSFMRGLGATNDHGDPHLTAIGHSYGSRLVGAATQEGGGIPGADDIVLLGSPGVGVDKAEDLGVGKNHVFVGAAENDPVSKLPSKQEATAGGVFMGGGPLLSYLAADIADQGDDDIWFGKDPASEAFGANRFKVDDGPRPIIDGEGPTPAHSNYFNPEKDPESAANVAAVVAGRPDLLTSQEHR